MFDLFKQIYYLGKETLILIWIGMLFLFLLFLLCLFKPFLLIMIFLSGASLALSSYGAYKSVQEAKGKRGKK